MRAGASCWVQDRILQRQGRRATTPGRRSAPSLPRKTKDSVLRPGAFIGPFHPSFCGGRGLCL
jgi:hypothetical protein